MAPFKPSFVKFRCYLAVHLLIMLTGFQFHLYSLISPFLDEQQSLLFHPGRRHSTIKSLSFITQLEEMKVAHGNGCGS